MNELVLSALLKTNITFENRPGPKRKHSLSTFNHHLFTGYVSVRECDAHHNLSRIEWCHSIFLHFCWLCHVVSMFKKTSAIHFDVTGKMTTIYYKVGPKKQKKTLEL